ncbi:MAG: iron-sulfur cluster assembly protein [Gammaproteobacteria bacterium]|nr:iron-sulfur cluster assembly protein [Gammaproteobacteria bacterium]
MTVSENDILEALSTVMDPELNRNVVELGFIQEVDIAGDYVHLEIQLTTPMCPRADEIVAMIKNAAESVDGIREAEVERSCMKNA